MRIVIAAIAAALLSSAASAQADEVAQKGRDVLDRYKDAVITVQAVVSVSFGGSQRESEGEATGTVVAPDGLTIMSLTALDPTTMYDGMGPGGGDVVSKISSLRMLMPDNVEHVAEVVLRDRELDLAFVRPVERQDAPFVHVDITQDAAPELLDHIAVLMQLGRVGRRAHAVMIERVESIIDRPRTMYVGPEHRARAFMSSPAFTLDGAFVGLGVMRSIRGRAIGGMGDSVLLVFVSARDIALGIEQVPDWGQSPEADDAEELGEDYGETPMD